MGRENAKAFLRRTRIAQEINAELREMLLASPAGAEANGSGNAQAAVAT